MKLTTIALIGTGLYILSQSKAIGRTVTPPVPFTTPNVNIPITTPNVFDLSSIPDVVTRLNRATDDPYDTRPTRSWYWKGDTKMYRTQYLPPYVRAILAPGQSAVSQDYLNQIMS